MLYCFLEETNSFVKRSDDAKEQETVQMLTLFLKTVSEQPTDDRFEWWYQLFLDSCGDFLFPGTCMTENKNSMIFFIFFLF